ncbi:MULTISPECIES: bifunctional ADP-dependent NAD(P)H-hydrate dehydratase/NAD(P)H-hydrate epimerase [unclassified Bacillus (in: firmicutes)]|uniref:bifunctional ADP-dependent NAD(P)H-hydrate dehydratase/NAD(P)H-hydrate epimerase n=2 Tax=Bacillales TaxID=1385 RepID=UPI0004E0ED5E|nr:MULTISPECIES: bifunctional ADP-dependent NAD(P)H-hydrate dehydratase/NAD(P)H-hydrate epimerase [unclassified Bacillus (in: firmicutes)]MCM3362334.1 bifunctional ADP-dependent NAD(P)H-hydrate dehydratase/NAD(P)H-hydrate epimerase [Niallia sp. MER TA 168]CAI9393199.1 Bifunctional NAD(P)H-hydrate repair enzyme Nnr [Bacillus sp. T2.9-1]
MEYLLNCEEMKRCDVTTIQKIGMPSMVLMERAALSVVEELDSFDLTRVLVVCGSGNNGADGYAVARLLHLQNIKVDVLFVGDEQKRTTENKQQQKIAEYYGVSSEKKIENNPYTTIVDALFGIGLSRPLSGKYLEIIEQVNQAEGEILSVDIPSGISADNGKVMGNAIKATRTVTFAFRKLGLVLYPGADYAGVVKVKDIGITARGFEGRFPKIYTYTRKDLERIPRRQSYSNKGTYGKILVVAGSKNMSGAAYFSAKAAYRMGAGLVRIVTPEENRQILQTLLPESIVTTYQRSQLDGDWLTEAINWASAIVIGPGMGISEEAKYLLSKVLSISKVPLVIDADAITLVAKEPELLHDHEQKIIMTPHVGEMSRLTGKPIPKIADDIIEVAEKFAAEKKLTCVLKDARTIVTEGTEDTYVNTSGNNGMATGGTGDVLTGVIVGLLAQGLREREAARLGVYIHGLAGDAAAAQKGPYGMLADDVCDAINEVVR